MFIMEAWLQRGNTGSPSQQQPTTRSSKQPTKSYVQLPALDAWLQQSKTNSIPQKESAKQSTSGNAFRLASQSLSINLGTFSGDIHLQSPDSSSTSDAHDCADLPEDTEEDDVSPAPDPTTAIHEDFIREAAKQEIDIGTVALPWLTSTALINAMQTACPQAHKTALNSFLNGATQHSVSTPAPLPTPTSENGVMEQLWDNYTGEECKASGLRVCTLVKPSGTLSHQVILRLHYPTYRTRYTNFGEVADQSNPNTNLLIKAGFNGSNCLWLEELYRRTKAPKKRGCPYTFYEHLSPAVRDINRQLTESLAEKSRARVEIIFGACQRPEVEKPNVVSFKMAYDDVEIKIGLQFVRVADRFTLSRVLILADHPEHVILSGIAGLKMTVAKRFDVALGLAAAIGKVQCFKYGYFEWRVLLSQLTSKALVDILKMRASQSGRSGAAFMTSGTQDGSLHLGAAKPHLSQIYNNRPPLSQTFKNRPPLQLNGPSTTPKPSSQHKPASKQSGPSTAEISGSQMSTDVSYDNLPDSIKAYLSESWLIDDAEAFEDRKASGESTLGFLLTRSMGYRSTAVEDPSYFSLPVLVRSMLAKKHAIKNATDLQRALKPGESIVEFVFRKFPPQKKTDPRRRLDKSGHTTRNGPQPQVTIRSEGCSKIMVDTMPIWTTGPCSNETQYIAKKRTCREQGCEVLNGRGKPKIPIWYPVDQSISHIFEETWDKRHKQSVRKANQEVATAQDENETTEATFKTAWMITRVGPRPAVELACQRCKEERGRDEAPLWFRRDGTYVAHTRNCSVCKKKGRPWASFFIPIETEGLGYIRRSALHYALGGLNDTKL